MSVVKVNLDPYYIYADPLDGTGHLFVEQGVGFEAHIRLELELLLPTAQRFLDIGANVGFHTITAKCIRPDLPILAIEANPDSAALLAQAAVEQHHHTITLLTTALFDRCGFVHIDRSCSNAVVAPTGAWPDKGYCAATTLNIHDTSGVDVVKMDIDGFEYLALLGASRLLATRPTIIFEYHLGVIGRSGIEGPELLRLLQSHGYSLTVLTPVRLHFGQDVNALHHHVLTLSEQCTDILATPL